MVSDELKRCPFCGSRKVRVSRQCVGSPPRWEFVIECTACGAEGPSGGTSAGAEENWNRRFRGDRDEDRGA